jgi:hypothetical protein
MTKNNLWFKQKKYGWGWTPCNWKGWVTIAIYVAVLAVYPMMADYGFVEYEKTMLFFWGFTILWIASLFFILIKKGEKPKWHWGK